MSVSPHVARSLVLSDRREREHGERRDNFENYAKSGALPTRIPMVWKHVFRRRLPVIWLTQRNMLQTRARNAETFFYLEPGKVSTWTDLNNKKY